jgi:ABC-type Zn uptake system ZnuABC Zn-binding protein ZnuA
LKSPRAYQIRPYRDAAADIAALMPRGSHVWREKPQFIATIRKARLIVVKGAPRHGFARDS